MNHDYIGSLWQCQMSQKLRVVLAQNSKQPSRIHFSHGVVIEKHLHIDCKQIENIVLPPNIFLPPGTNSNVRCYSAHQYFDCEILFLAQHNSFDLIRLQPLSSANARGIIKATNDIPVK